MRRKAYLLCFAIAALLTGFFVLRAVFFAFSWMDPDRGLHPIEGWMTPRYIARTYDIPRLQMQEILELAPNETPRIPLEKLAEQRGIPVGDLIREFEALLVERPPE